MKKNLQNKREPTKWEKIFDKELISKISKIYKEIIQLTNNQKKKKKKERKEKNLDLKIEAQNNYFSKKTSG